MRLLFSLLLVGLLATPARGQPPGATPPADPPRGGGPPGETPVTSPSQVDPVPEPPPEPPPEPATGPEPEPAPEPEPEPAAEPTPEAAPEPAPDAAPDAAPDHELAPPSAVTPKAENGLAVIALEELPAACRALGKRAMRPNRLQALPARISLANCVADARVAELDLIDAHESVVAIDDALAPSLTLLDEVVAAGAPALRVMAHHAIAQLYTGMMSRMLATVPPPPGTTPEALALTEARRQLLEAMLVPWRDRALAAHEAVLSLAKQHPDLGRDRVAQGAIAASRQYVAQAQVASSASRGGKTGTPREL